MYRLASAQVTKSQLAFFAMPRTEGILDQASYYATVFLDVGARRADAPSAHRASGN
jgi:hypothetical protein